MFLSHGRWASGSADTIRCAESGQYQIVSDRMGHVYTSWLYREQHILCEGVHVASMSA
jgi:hypothetical protein